MDKMFDETRKQIKDDGKKTVEKIESGEVPLAKKAPPAPPKPEEKKDDKGGDKKDEKKDDKKK